MAYCHFFDIKNLFVKTKPHPKIYLVAVGCCASQHRQMEIGIKSKLNSFNNMVLTVFSWENPLHLKLKTYP